MVSAGQYSADREGGVLTPSGVHAALTVRHHDPDGQRVRRLEAAVDSEKLGYLPHLLGGGPHQVVLVTIRERAEPFSRAPVSVDEIRVCRFEARRWHQRC
jgi:hypothetical protein